MLLVALLFACDDGGKPDATLDSGGDSGGGGDSGEGTPTPPCADGGWGLITPDDETIHVRADGSDEGDGGADTPVATLDAALELARGRGGAARFAVGPGTYAAQLGLGELFADADGLTIEGCGPGEVTLEAAADWDSVIRVNGLQDVRLAGFTVSGGRRAVMVYGGATATLESLEVRDSSRVGIVWDGNLTAGTATDVSVRDTVGDPDDDGAYGYGVLIQGAQVTIVGGGVYDSVRAGLLVHDATASVVLDGFAVENTSPGADGALGRGIQVQELAQLAMTGGGVSGCSDAGIFARQALAVDLSGVSVADTALAVAPDGGEAAGDGIVVTQGDTDLALDPGTFLFTMADTTVSGSARAGVLLDGVTAELGAGNVLTDNAYDPGAGAPLAQGGAVVTGVTSFDLDAAGTPLDVFGAALDDDALLDLGVEP